MEILSPVESRSAAAGGNKILLGNQIDSGSFLAHLFRSDLPLRIAVVIPVLQEPGIEIRGIYLAYRLST